MTVMTLHDILEQALPGRTMEESVGLGLVYAGIHWKKDFHWMPFTEIT